MQNKLFQYDLWSVLEIAHLFTTLPFHHLQSCVYTQNDRVRRKHQHIIEAELTFLAQSHFLSKY